MKRVIQEGTTNQEFKEEEEKAEEIKKLFNYTASPPIKCPKDNPLNPLKWIFIEEAKKDLDKMEPLVEQNKFADADKDELMFQFDNASPEQSLASFGTKSTEGNSMFSCESDGAYWSNEILAAENKKNVYTEETEDRLETESSKEDGLSFSADKAFASKAQTKTLLTLFENQSNKYRCKEEISNTSHQTSREESSNPEYQATQGFPFSSSPR